MQCIWEEVLDAVSCGCGFKVDYKTRSLDLVHYRGRKREYESIIKDGKYDGLLGVPPVEMQDVLHDMDELYKDFERSIPTEHTRQGYFLAEKDLVREDYRDAETREYAQCALEMYLLMMLINGSFRPEDMAKPFYQSEAHPKMIIWKKWFNNKNN